MFGISCREGPQNFDAAYFMRVRRVAGVRKCLMKRLLFVLVITVLMAAGCTSQSDKSAGPPLPTGRWIDTSLAESSQDVGQMPLNVVISPDGRYAVTTGAGYSERLCSVRIADGKQVSFLDYPIKPDKTNGLYYGIAFGPDGRLYAAQGAAKAVAVIGIDANGQLSRIGQIRMQASDFPSGVAVDANGGMYVTQNDPTNALVFGTPASVSVHDTSTGKELGRYVFADDVGLSNFPLAITVNADGSRVYVGSERDDAVCVLDASDPTKISLVARIDTGSHPVALLLNKSRSRLYVANAQSDTISIVDTAANRVVSTVLVRPEVARDLAGATPTGLALSGDETTLYATLGDMNAVAVIDLDDKDGPKLEGYIPTGWYPTSVAVAGNELLVTNAKGDKARVPHNFATGRTVTSPLYLFEGTLWRIAVPDEDDLGALTQKCLADARLTPEHLSDENPLDSLSIHNGVIKHVIYIIKENRTYDQLLGDEPAGNGDPNRCIFPREVTPNLHALAERFILLDNFYDCGEVSGDGWTWSTEGQANEYTIRNVPYQYSHRGRKTDYEGSNNSYPSGGFPAVGPDGKPMSDDPRFKEGGKPVADVAESPGGHLWDMARKLGLSYRNYGCFLTFGVKSKGKTVIPDNYPASAGVQPGGFDLAGITDVNFRRFDLNFPDSDAPARLASQTGDHAYLWKTASYGRNNMSSRIAEWKREFGMMLAKDPTGGAVPALMMVRLPTDHTSAARSLVPTPRCMVADNDYAVGELVEAVTHSAIWSSTVIVVLEDDAQNGPDHVDAHRSICLIVSPWMKRGAIDHSFQNTDSAIRTIECLLSLPPMCQYDAAAGVIGGWDDAPRNSRPYDAIEPSAAIFKERNPYNASQQEPVSPEDSASLPPDDVPLKNPADLAAVSARMDFSQADRVPADLLNRVIWKTVRGPDSEMPPTPHSVAAAGKILKDDDGD